jgi:hypothetical protein
MQDDCILATNKLKIRNFALVHVCYCDKIQVSDQCNSLHETIYL